MRRTVLLPAAALFLILFPIMATAQDFQKSYRLSPGGRITVHTVSGGVNVTGYDGEAILVTAYKTGRDRDLIAVEDRSGAHGIELRARYPASGIATADLSFEIKVPRHVAYQFDDLWTASGGIEVADVLGSLRVNSASGKVSIKNFTGPISVSTASSDIEASAVRFGAGQGSRMEFTSASGSVSVSAPADLDARVEMSTLTGSLATDFPLEVQRAGQGAHAASSRAHGRLGSGAHSLRIQSTSGSVSLRRL